jgi:fructose-1,6-bisphosphatase/sedoheptulose 1,7-bisphosphatase-like protein
MALEPGQIAHVSDLYLQKLAADPDARARLAAAADPAAVAREIASATDANVTEDDLAAMTQHFATNRKAEVASLSTQHPAMAIIIFGSA